mmetsp:Transcript_56543/g.93443  ORF Transcript_56543/g.93443 Transcript_56543/m.93443 type:complete len:481 (-) Transcript_56543:283-1725(-)
MMAKWTVADSSSDEDAEEQPLRSPLAAAKAAIVCRNTQIAAKETDPQLGKDRSASHDTAKGAGIPTNNQIAVKEAKLQLAQTETALAVAKTKLKHANSQVTAAQKEVERLVEALKQSRKREDETEEERAAAAAEVNSLKTAKANAVLQVRQAAQLAQNGSEADDFEKAREHEDDAANEEEEEEDYPCSICMEPGNGECMMLCDLCNNAFHSFCLNPPLSKVPDGSWFCKQCDTARHNFLHKRIEVYWKQEKKWFAGQVQALSHENNKIISHVVYDLGDQFWHDLNDKEMPWRHDRSAPAQKSQWPAHDTTSSVADLTPSKRTASSLTPTGRPAKRSSSSCVPTETCQQQSAQVISLLARVLMDDVDHEWEHSAQPHTHAAAHTKPGRDSGAPAATQIVRASTSSSTITMQTADLVRSAEELATAIESEIRLKYGSDDTRDYRRLSRELISCLTRNVELRSRVLLGEFTPQQLIIEHTSIA